MTTLRCSEACGDWFVGGQCSGASSAINRLVDGHGENSDQKAKTTETPSQAPKARVGGFLGDLAVEDSLYILFMA